MFQNIGKNTQVGYFYTVAASIAPAREGRHSRHLRGTIMKMQSTPQTPQPNGPVPISFCILLFPDGTIERMVDQPLDEYFAAVKKASMVWIDCSTTEDEKGIEQIAQSAGFSKIPIPKLTTGFYSAYEDYDSELGIMLPSVTVKTETMTVHPLFVLIRENIVITIHSDKINRLLRLSRYAPQFFKRISTENIPDKITLMLERIIDENNDRNFEYLREIEMHGDAISKSLIEENLAKRKIAHDIYRMKHVLIDYLNVLWATKDVVDSLRYGDADLITNDEKLLGRIGILSDNIDRHIELSEQMSNVLSSGLEVMQSIYNNQLQNLNNRFALVTAYLTVLGTAFLVPNTIATIAGSGIMEGTMAAQWWYVPLLIGSTVIATLVSFLWVLHVWKKRDEVE
jgi:magnesium transporter